MKRTILLFSWLCAAAVLVAAEMQPVFMETFDRCIDEEDDDSKYTGGNDDEWGGDIAKADVIYTAVRIERRYQGSRGAFEYTVLLHLDESFLKIRYI